MKVRKRLYDAEALELGLTLNKKLPSERQSRYYLDEEVYNIHRCWNDI